MVAGSGVARAGEARVSTGNPSIDRMLEGGLVARRPYLIVGASGTGKTTLALQFLVDGIQRGERALLVTLEEPPNEARMNHRGLQPALDRVDVFDAIPDIMRYERTPFKDIAAVRAATPFSEVALEIRKSPELASVEVTITALEQMLRTEVVRRGYTRVVIDSLTALQYFCMKGFEPVAGAQSFLRFLSDLRVTTLLTVEAPLEDVETPERMLARGEIRLFRWELDGHTVRAVGVEKFRGSSHDVRLHPYRIGPKGIDINLDVTISRDTRQIIEPLVRLPAPPTAVAVTPIVSSVTPLVDEVRDLVLLGADVQPARKEIEAALEATNASRLEEAQTHLSRVSSLVIRLVDSLGEVPRPFADSDASATAAYQRVLARADSVRTGVPPTSLPETSVLQVQLGALLSLLPAPTPPTPPAVVPAATVEAPLETVAPPTLAVPAPPEVVEVPPPPPPPPPPEPLPAAPAQAPVESVPPPPPDQTPPENVEIPPPPPPEPLPSSQVPEEAVPVLEDSVAQVSAPEAPALDASLPEEPAPHVPAPEVPATGPPSEGTPSTAAEVAVVAEAPAEVTVTAEVEPPAADIASAVPPAVESAAEPATPAEAPEPSTSEERIVASETAIVPEVLPSVVPAEPPAVTTPPPPVKQTRAEARVLPAPPKPRSSLTPPKPPRESATAPHREAAARSTEPPPLPSNQVPDWDSSAAATPPAPPVPTLPSTTTAEPPPHPSGRAGTGPAKRRRKSATATAGHKKSPASTRAPASPEPTVPVASPPLETDQPPALPGPETPAVVAPSTEAAPKPRKRAPRKRKAPPVISAEAAPIPPGAPESSETPPANPEPAARGPPEG